MTSPPTQLWLGMIEGQWPVQAFTVESHVIHWLTTGPALERRRAWPATVTLGPEVRVQITEPVLVPKDS